MGHSMGALTTLGLASQSPLEIPLFIVLVAPAFGAVQREAKPDQKKRRVYDPLVAYVLRRVVD